MNSHDIQERKKHEQGHDAPDADLSTPAPTWEPTANASCPRIPNP